MTLLSVNLNKIALLRNSRLGDRPSVVNAARQAIEQGALGITVHPRPDQRHIHPQDVYDLARLLKEEYPLIEFNIEGNPFAAPRDNGYPGFDAIIKATSPQQVTLVPDNDDQLTSDHGWNLSEGTTLLKEKIAFYHSVGARVSLFMDPIREQIIAARAHEAERIEFYTGPYAETYWANGATHQATQASFATYTAAAKFALEIGLGVNAGHDLDQTNLPLFATLPGLQEVSIGHAIICESLESGFAPTIRAYVDILT